MHTEVARHRVDGVCGGHILGPILQDFLDSRCRLGGILSSDRFATPAEPFRGKLGTAGLSRGDETCVEEDTATSCAKNAPPAPPNIKGTYRSQLVSLLSPPFPSVACSASALAVAPPQSMGSQVSRHRHGHRRTEGEQGRQSLSQKRSSRASLGAPRGATARADGPQPVTPTTTPAATTAFAPAPAMAVSASSQSAAESSTRSERAVFAVPPPTSASAEVSDGLPAFGQTPCPQLSILKTLTGFLSSHHHLLSSALTTTTRACRTPPLSPARCVRLSPSGETSLNRE